MKAQRILILVKDKQQAHKLQEQIGLGAFYMGGRTLVRDDACHCQRKDQYDRYIQAHQNAGRDWCVGCHQELKLAGFTCPFKESERLAEQATVVIGVYQSYLNDSEKIKDFDLIVIDENPLSCLAERRRFTLDDLSYIRNLLRQNHVTQYPAEPQHPIWRVLDSVGKMLGQSPQNMVDAGTVFREIYGSYDLSELCQAEWQVPTIQESFSFEIPQSGSSEIPRRMLADLLVALTDGRKSAGLTSQGIVYYRPYKAVEVLKTKRVVVLDATPPMALYQDMFGAENLYQYGGQTALANVHLTQVTGRTYTRSVLKQSPQLLRDLEQMIHHFIQDYERPLIVALKDFVAEAWSEESCPKEDFLLKINHPGARQIWYGNQTRASNDFQDCDVIVLVMHYQEPLDHLRLRVNALRLSPPGPVDIQRIPQSLGMIGQSFVPGRLQYSDLDPLVQATFNDLLAGEIIQAINRGRNILRPEPLPVIIINGFHLPGVPVDEVVDGRTFCKTEPSPKRQGQNLKDLNYKREAKARQRIIDYLEQCPNASLNQIQKAIGGSKSTIKKHVKAICEGIPDGTHDLDI